VSGGRCFSDAPGYRPTSLSMDELFQPVMGSWSALASKSVVWGRLVVNEGERVAVWSRHGGVQTVDGPRSVFLFGTQVQRLARYVAGPAEFVSVLRKNGQREVVRGPVSVWQDPVEHESVGVYRAMNLNANEALVTYRESKGEITREVVAGPALFTPQAASEWVHQFVWHGNDPSLHKHGVNRKLQGGLRFTKLRLIPDQLYFDVEKVRTRDDALLTVKTMIFFQLEDIEKMVENTHDVVSELINSISADIIEKTSSLTFDEFRQATGDFNGLAAYPGLVTKAGSIGYRVTKVVFRGYEASSTLQTMHDSAIESRTQLRLNAEREQQEQDLKDLQQERKHQRGQKARDEEELAERHASLLGSLRAAAELQQKREAEEQGLVLEERRVEAQRGRREEELRALERHYAVLHDLGVDLSQHLAQRPHRVVRFEQGRGDRGEVAVQYHMNDGERQ